MNRAHYLLIPSDTLLKLVGHFCIDFFCWSLSNIPNTCFCLYLQVFGDKAFEKFGKGFISMHFSDQHPGTHKKMLLFKFALPDANNMADMTRLVALVPYYIDLVGRYKLSTQVVQNLFIFWYPTSSELAIRSHDFNCDL